MLTEISAALDSANTLKTLVSSVMSAKDLAEKSSILSEINELYGKLAAINVVLAQIGIEHEAVLRENSKLKARLEQLERKQADLERYDLHELSTGVFTYALRETASNGEPFHHICSRCRNEGKKFLLRRVDNGSRIYHECPACKQQFTEKITPMSVRSLAG